MYKQENKKIMKNYFENEGKTKQTNELNEFFMKSNVSNCTWSCSKEREKKSYILVKLIHRTKRQNHTHTHTCTRKSNELKIFVSTQTNMQFNPVRNDSPAKQTNNESKTQATCKLSVGMCERNAKTVEMIRGVWKRCIYEHIHCNFFF